MEFTWTTYSQTNPFLVTDDTILKKSSMLSSDDDKYDADAVSPVDHHHICHPPSPWQIVPGATDSEYSGFTSPAEPVLPRYLHPT